MTELAQPGSVLRSERVYSASPQAIFSVFEQPEILARWWGPDGFTNSFQVFEFKPGGRWIFVMHGPNGIDYPNESVFREIQPETRIVIDHLSSHWFRLTITLEPIGERTRLTWEQEFESPEVADRFRPICAPANEQNLTRLQEILGQARG